MKNEMKTRRKRAFPTGREPSIVESLHPRSNDPNPHDPKSHDPRRVFSFFLHPPRPPSSNNSTLAITDRSIVGCRHCLDTDTDDGDDGDVNDDDDDDDGAGTGV